MIEHLEEVAEYVWTARHPHGPSWSEVKDFPRGEKYRDVSRAAIAALSVIQKDMVIVPREATDAMVKAAYEAQQKALAECEASDCGSDHLRAAINAAVLSVVE